MARQSRSVGSKSLKLLEINSSGLEFVVSAHAMDLVIAVVWVFFFLSF